MVKRRRYDSRRRAEQADATQAAILDAAFSLFTVDGYVATSIKAVADRAGVAVPTVYAAFKDKPGILMAVSSRVLGGIEPTSGPGDLEQFSELRSEPDPRRRLQMVMSFALETYDRGVYELEAVIIEAARADPRVREMTGDVLEARLATHRVLVELILEGVTLEEGVTVEQVAEFVDAVDSGPVFQLLTGARGWSNERYSRWISMMFESMFLHADDR